MAEFGELVQALTWLLTNRIQQKIDYTHGLLGDGNGRVRVSTIPGAPEVDYVYVRPDRFSNRTFKVFNKRVEGQDGDPVIIGELPWEPGLIQVVDMDWAAYADIGWGDDITSTSRHGTSHQWLDGAPGIDTFNIYRRQFGDLKTYPAVSGTLAVGVSPYTLDIFGTQYQWPGNTSFSLSSALPAGTGTARMALVYWSPASGTTGYLGIAQGDEGASADPTILNRPATPQGTIPSAFVRLAGGQNSITEFDIWDAREPFRPGLLFGTGTAGLSADMIPISDTSGYYTGSTVESALEEIPSTLDITSVSKLYESDFGAVAFEADADGNLTLNGTRTLTIPTDLIHAGDTDTKISFADDDIEFTAGNLSMLKLTEAGQDLITLGPGSGDVDIDFNGDMTLQGSDGRIAINQAVTQFVRLKVLEDSFDSVINVAVGGEVDTTNNTNVNYQSIGGTFTVRYRGTNSNTNAKGISGVASSVFVHNTNTTLRVTGFTLDMRNLGAGTVSNMYGARVPATINSGGGTITNFYGYRVETQTVATNNYGFYQAGSGINVFEDDVKIGSSGTPSAQLHVDNASIQRPVLYLDQGDVSEEMIEFATTIGTGNAIEAVGAKTLTTTHFIKVTLPGSLTRYIPVGTIA